jgi:hypothetical protein
MEARKGSGLKMNKQNDLSKNVRDNIIHVAIKQRGDKIIRIVNI